MPKPLRTSGEKRFLDGYIDDKRIGGPNHLCPPSANVDLTKTGEAMSRRGIIPAGFDLGQAGKTSIPLHVSRFDVTLFACNGKILFVNHNNSDAVVDTGIALTETDGSKTMLSEYAGDVYLTNTTDGLRQIHLGRINGAASASADDITIDQDMHGRFFAFSKNESTINGTIGIANTSSFTEAYSITKSGTVTNAADNGAGLIRITTSASHGLTTGCSVTIASVGGTTEANGTWTITKINATNFDLQGSAFSNVYTAGGTTSYNPNGVLPLTGTLNADVADNTIVWVVKDRSTSAPKASGITFGKERMILWGIVSDTAKEAPTNIVYMSSFALISGAGGTALANIIDFNTSNTAAEEMVGKAGIVTNVLSTRDYLYIFTENETYYGGVEDVNTTTGGMPPRLLSNLYGCVNNRAAVDMGNGKCAFLTKNKRVMGISIATETGAPVVFPDESFDRPISNTVALLDADQSDSFFFYAPNDHRAYMHVNADGERIVLKYNTEIQRMEPPNTGWSFRGMYVRNGVTYATELNDDAVWQLGEGYQDDGISYESIAAPSRLEGEDGRVTLHLNAIAISGRGSDLEQITLENYVGEGTPQQKIFRTVAGASSGSIGSVTLGATTLGAAYGTELTDYDEYFGIYPTHGTSYQPVIRSLGAFTLSSYSVYGSALSRPLLTLK